MYTIICTYQRTEEEKRISRGVADQFRIMCYVCETGVRNYTERSFRESLIGFELLPVGRGKYVSLLKL